MKITKMDNFGEGFRVKPRPKHKCTETIKRLTLAEQQLPVRTAIKNRLINEGYVQVAAFREPKQVHNSIGDFRNRLGMKIEQVKVGSELVGYRLIGQ